MPLLAQNFDQVFGRVNPPQQIQNLTNRGGAEGISFFLTNIINLFFAVSGVVFIFMIIFGAFQWMTSGGDKEAVAKARSRITHAIIGIILLSLAFLIITIIGEVTGFEFTRGQRFSIIEGQFRSYPH